MTARALVDLGSLEEAEALLRWVRRLRRAHRRAPRAAAPAVHGRRLRARRRGGHRHAARLRRLPAGAGRQRRQPPAPARRVRPGRRPARAPSPTPAARSATRSGGCWRRWSRRSSGAGTSPTTACGRPACPPRHHVYSKVMCWLTVDRALHVLREHARLQDRPEWVDAARPDRRRTCSSTAGTRRPARTRSPTATPEMDASSLWIGLSGLLARRRPAVPGHRAQGRGRPAQRPGRLPVPLGRRPARPRGRLPPLHGVADRGVPAHRPPGRRRGAVRRRWSTAPGPTGLLPEQYDPMAERGLGNHPQAYSHLGLIRCALLLDEAASSRRASTTSPIDDHRRRRIPAAAPPRRRWPAWRGSPAAPRGRALLDDRGRASRGGRPPSISAAAMCRQVLQPHEDARACRAAGPARPSPRATPGWPGGRCPETTVNSCATPRWVTGMPAAAGAATALVTPGTTVTGTPAAAHASASSPPRPKTYGSPPLSRTTNRPCRARSTRIALISSWARGRAVGDLRRVDQLGVRAQLVEQQAGGEPVGDHDVGRGEQPAALDGDQLRVARAAADQRHPARAARRRSAAGRRWPPRRWPARCSRSRPARRPRASGRRRRAPPR